MVQILVWILLHGWHLIFQACSSIRFLHGYGFSIYSLDSSGNRTSADLLFIFFLRIAFCWDGETDVYFVFVFRTTADGKGKAVIVKNLIRKKYEELGPMTFHELVTLILFISCVALWFFRDPQFITGWSEFLPAV